MLALFGKDAYGSVGKILPAAALVRTCLVGLYGKRGIEQQYTLIGPAGEVSIGRERLPQIALYLLEYVL